ncbi:ferredoxin--NADP reductase [Nocardia vulneris]|uniref:3-ketosteroid-9-alpha-hydroxylase n=1 Tax=Nocardia vulneris TaxID=1141657 RepID=A0ABR4ZNH7_9NOCA|nr:ferredoxin--NADP reductase [Nocardia vulneris]KIA66803.1 3-ketosteroid-9-alpha-hydroxylase [Nocardia vulneris]
MNRRAHDVRVYDVVQETPEAVSIVLGLAPELRERFAYTCGQFLTVRVPSEQTGSVARCYSLSGNPHRDEVLTVTVKRVAGGYASNWLCDNIVPGSTLTVLEPSGTFGPDGTNGDLLLLAAGSGITPVMSIIKTVLACGTGDVVLIYANRDPESTIFAGQLEQLTREHPDRFQVRHWFETDRGVPDAAAFTPLVAPFAARATYLCGPAGFMAVAAAALAGLGVPASRMHREEYRSLTENPFEQPEPTSSPGSPGADGATLEVEIDGDRHTLTWPRQEKLLDVLLEQGIDVPYVCRESICGTCVCSVRKGRTRMVLNDSLPEKDVQQGLTLACQSLPETDEIFIAFDQ